MLLTCGLLITCSPVQAAPPSREGRSIAKRRSGIAKGSGPLLLLALLATVNGAPAEVGETSPSPQSSAKDNAAIVLPPNAPEPVRWAARELVQRLESRGASCTPPPAAFQVSLQATAAAEESREALPASLESFGISIPADGPVTVAGSDPTGAMYGLQELAEQLDAAPAAASWPALRAALRPVKARPAVRIRALNIFLHLTPDGDLAAWFHDEEFWQRLLDLLARSRFNLLDIHGVYDPASTQFPNLLPHFTGGGAAEGNRAMLRRVVAWAADRGIRVGLMNYDYREPHVDAAEQRLAATAARVEELLRDLPGLALFGWRFKRTGGGAVRAFEESCMAPARRAGFGGAFYTRSWGTDRDTVDRLARRCDGRLAVEVKFNGEQLGAPYPALHGWGEDYSFQGFLLHPREYEVLWQVRANGTLRVFPWADPEFVRHAAEGLTLGGAAGFSVEPHWAYFGVRPDERYRDGAATLAEGDRYLFERDAFCYTLWGRLTYDPATPDEIFVRFFTARYGPRAGPAAFRTLAAMSRIVPAVYCAYAMGVDHRDAAPEMEIGLLNKERDHARSLDELCAIRPLDRARGCSPAEFAAAVASARDDPRTTPVQAAAELDRFAAETDAAAAELSAMTARGRRDAGGTTALPEAHNAAAAQKRTLALEARAVAALGLSTAARLRALTAFAFYRRGKDARWLTRSQEELARAAEQWRQLAGIADTLHLPVADPLRAGPAFTWGSVLPHFERLEAELKREIAAARKKKQPDDGARTWAEAFERGRATFDKPVVSFARHGEEELRVRIRFPDAASAPRSLTLLYKPLDSDAPWRAKQLEAKDGSSFMAKLDEPPDGLLVQFQALDEQGRGWLWPPEREGKGYVWTALSRREAGE